MHRASRIAKTRELAYELRIADVMRGDVVTVTPDTPMSRLQEVLRRHGISGVPVVADGELVGMISLQDLIEWLSECGDDKPVRERMTRQLVALHADQPIVQAVESFDRLGFGRFPVLDRDTGRLVGILTKGNIVEGLLRRLEKEYAEEEERSYRASHIFEDIIADRREIRASFDLVGKDFDRAGRASTRMKKNLQRLGMSPEAIRRLAIASYEAEMNVVIHANRGSMLFSIRPEEVVLEVDDEGPGIVDIEQAMQPGYSTSPDWVRALGFGAGMGLSNIERCTDAMELHSTPGVGAHLRVVVRLVEEPAGASVAAGSD